MTDSDKAIALRPSYWASVSGGKDSLYMLNYILHNLDRYPLDGVVHFELEIDYPFIHNVIDYMETECKRAGIQFVRIKPRKTWEELYDKCGFPTRKVRWCNGHYKLDAKRQLSEWLNEVGFYVVHYIGYCADEERRFNKRLSAKKLEIYPLVENGLCSQSEIAQSAPEHGVCRGCIQMTILANIIGGAALAAMFVVFYALGVSAGREATQQRKEDISMEHTHGGKK